PGGYVAGRGGGCRPPLLPGPDAPPLPQPHGPPPPPPGGAALGDLDPSHRLRRGPGPPAHPAGHAPPAGARPLDGLGLRARRSWRTCARLAAKISAAASASARVLW